ncbi:hypothetical protein [Sphingobacterium paucimobilis]|uniref:hypothetical protein n=1 Tax=Sphingobacterium paucimobilis TaxID=1385985 RepID=UPI0003F82FB5|nr:hypothetical protein [Sphingobacterium paucimobilis]
MSKLDKYRDGNKGVLDVAFFLSPIAGVFALLFSTTHSRAIKITTVLAAITGLIASAIIYA